MQPINFSSIQGISPIKDMLKQADWRGIIIIQAAVLAIGYGAYYFSDGSGIVVLAMMVIWAGLVPTMLWDVIDQVRLYRISKFASDNGFTFKQNAPEQHEQFKHLSLFGKSGWTQWGIVGTLKETPFTIAIHQRILKLGKYEKTYSYLIATIELPKSMPHIVLNTRKQKSIRADDFVASQRLSLEGNFDQYFDLYCPQQYEIETLALLNPSFMTTLIDSSGNYDIEINDTHLALCRTVSARFLSRFSFDRNRDFRVYGELFSALSQLVNHFDRKPSASSGLAVIGSLPPTLTKKSLLQRLPRTLRKTIKFVLIGLILWILYIAVIDSIIK